MRKALLIVSVAVFGLSFGGGEQAVSTFTDKRDGKVYRIVEIGGAVWMAENLNFAAKGSVCYDNKAANCAKYGRLYNWKTALTVCPAGTHLPDDDEWTTLENAVVGRSTAGTKLKSAAGWNEDGNGTDDYGFLALPSGGGLSDGNFDGIGNYGVWWSATEYDATYAWLRCMFYDCDYVCRVIRDKTSLYSVRCVQNKEGEQ